MTNGTPVGIHAARGAPVLGPGERWAADLPPPLLYVHRSQPGFEDFIACRICHRRWRHQEAVPISKQNVEFLIDHVWGHVLLPVVEPADFYQPPCWTDQGAADGRTAQQELEQLADVNARRSTWSRKVRRR